MTDGTTTRERERDRRSVSLPFEKKTVSQKIKYLFILQISRVHKHILLFFSKIGFEKIIVCLLIYSMKSTHFSLFFHFFFFVFLFSIVFIVIRRLCAAVKRAHGSFSFSRSPASWSPSDLRTLCAAKSRRREGTAIIVTYRQRSKKRTRSVLLFFFFFPVTLQLHEPSRPIGN